MATTTEGRIATALLRRVETMPTGGLPVAWPGDVTFDGDPFSPSDVAPQGGWVRVQLEPNGTTDRQIPSDGARRYIGLMQVSVFMPKGTREIVVKELAGAIAEHFPLDLPLVEDGVTVRITGSDTRGLQYQTEGLMMPVMIGWECYH